ncbi:MAG: hypothetical protein H6Q31_3222, partial [Bacteroidetes bacterium]|nr:hypothetical protein [Bacteroidota bacterium]
SPGSGDNADATAWSHASLNRTPSVLSRNTPALTDAQHMRSIALVFKLLVGAYILYVLSVLATSYAPGDRPTNPPFLVFVLDTMVICS